MPLVKIREKAQVTLPKQLMKDLGLQVGDMVDVEGVGKTLRLTPKSAVDRDIIAGRADYRAGRGKLFDSAEEMIAYLQAPPPRAKSKVHRVGKR